MKTIECIEIFSIVFVAMAIDSLVDVALKAIGIL